MKKKCNIKEKYKPKKRGKDMKKIKENIKAKAGIVAVFCICAMLFSGVLGFIAFSDSSKYKIDLNINANDETEEEWVLVHTFTLDPLGAIRQNVSDEASCIEFFMFYEHGNTADHETNTTVWDPDEGGFNAPNDVYGYTHTQGESNIDCDHTVAWDGIAKAKINLSDIGMDASAFDCNRSRAYLNMTNSGSWADGQNEASSISDGRIDTYNVSGQTFAYVTFYWDDSGGSGYAIFANGGFSFNINLEVKR